MPRKHSPCAVEYCSGDLPDNRRIAWAVLKRVLCARRAGGMSSQTPKGRLAGPPREQLFREAAHPCEPARIAARVVIRALVDIGEDPSDPEFVPPDLDVPEFGPVGLHLLGWPDRWVAPEHEAQMQRVMERHAALVGVPRTDAWWAEAASSLSAWLRRGVLPARADVEEFVLVVGEMFALHAHYFGRGSNALVHAYADLAAAGELEQGAALVHVAALRANGTEAADAHQ